MLTGVFKINKNEAPNEAMKAIKSELETICYRVPYLSADLPQKHKLLSSLSKFKGKNKEFGNVRNVSAN